MLDAHQHRVTIVVVYSYLCTPVDFCRTMLHIGSVSGAVPLLLFTDMYAHFVCVHPALVEPLNPRSIHHFLDYNKCKNCNISFANFLHVQQTWSEA